MHGRGRGVGRTGGGDIVQNILSNKSAAFVDGKQPNGKSSTQQAPAAEADQFEDVEADKNYLIDVMKKVTASYLDYEDDEINKSLGQTREIFDSMMADETNICLICLDGIHRAESIWSCGSCYCMMHLQCIQQWIKEGSYQQKLSTLSSEHFPNKKLPWHCPKCRTEYEHIQTPTLYKCFCSKKVDPVDDLWLVPHSCGETCDKKLKPECGHHCLLLCHPGPCPPCPKSVRVGCYCGQSAPATRRCFAREWTCGKTCNKLLLCGQHKCKELCHAGECKPCPEMSIQMCKCGKSKQKRPCAEPVWSCEQVCGRPLLCGNHYCDKLCHSPAECGTCEKATRVRYCPCGKTSSTDIPCTLEVPCCGDTCGKPLTCGMHFCTEKCHTGACGQCLQMTMKSCRCGAKQKEMPCVKSFTCETRCQNVKPCGRHQCKRRCCDGTSCPDCDQTCGKKLNCGNHKCISTCHSGPCYPCPITISKACNCAKTVISVPCIKQKVAKPPRCRHQCRKPSLCDHPSIQPHYCHFGDCPPCTLTCAKELRGCEHKCGSQCHDAVKVKVTQENKQAAGPWEQRITRYVETICRPCPPCPVPLLITCKGGHETSRLPCSNSGVYSCNRKCGRVLSCTNHTCTHECHDVTGSKESKTAAPECEVCEGPCEKPRPEGCSHDCLKPCHPGNCQPCKQMTKTRCHCGVTVMYIPCYQWTDKNMNKDEKLRCPGDCPKLLTCGHQCPEKCHPGSCDSKCSKKITIRCPCKSRKESILCCNSSNAKVECNEKCEAAKNSSKASDEGTETDEVTLSEMSEAEVAAMLPGRRQRKRKEKPVSDNSSGFVIPWEKVLSCSWKIAAVLAVLLAFYLAIISEN